MLPWIKIRIVEMGLRSYLSLGIAILCLRTSDGQGTQIQSNCPHLRYGANCLGKCQCYLHGTASCDHVSGRCRCKQGYSGFQCNKDVDECAAPGSDRLCQHQFQICENVYGSFDCACQSGYTQRRKNGRCYPCVGQAARRGCKTQCKCMDANTIGCSSDLGTCLCKPGWGGVRCERSVDDCVGNPCKDQPCEDRHKGYVCKCPQGQFYVGNECKDYHVGMMTINPTPYLGDRLEVYVLYSLPSDYYRRPDRLPNIDHQLFIDNKPFCRMSFHDFHTRATGRETFIQKYIKQSGNKLAINFYSVYLIPLMEAKLTTLLARPLRSELTDMSIVVDLRTKDPRMKTCFQNMRIANYSRCLRLNTECIHNNSVPNIKRQEYHRFQVVRDNMGQCTETPRFSWRYYSIKTIELQRDNCPNTQYIKMQNIYELEAKSGEPAITDHLSEVEIAPANFLPLGRVEICVAGLLRLTDNKGIVTCGSFVVQPTFKIKGKLNPFATYVYVDVTKNFHLHADFKELDHDVPLSYEWRYKEDKTGSSWLDLPIEGESDKPIVTMQSSAITPKATQPGEVVIVVQVKVFCKSDPTLIPPVLSEVRIELLQWEWGIHFYNPACLGTCDRVVGASRNVGVNPRYDPTDAVYHSLLNRTFTIEEDGKAVGLQRYKKITGFEPHTSYIKTKANTLKPGKKYKIIYTDYYNTTKKLKGNITSMVTKGYLEYEFDVEPPPVGDGCTISPKSGKAIFTPFNFECKNYVDTVAGLPVVYHLVQKDHVVHHSEEFYNLIAYGGEPRLTNISLSSPEVGTTTTINLKMRVINVKGSAAEVEFNVTLEVEDQKKIVKEVMASSMLKKSKDSRQENVRSVTNVATVIQQEATASKNDKILLRNSLLSNLENFDSQTAESVEHTSLALEKSSSKEDEIGLGGLNSGLTAGEHLTKHVGKVSNENFEKVKQVATLLAFAVSRLVHIASVVGNSAMRGLLAKNKTKKSYMEENKKHSKKGIGSMDNVVDVLARNVRDSHQRLNVTTDHVDIGVELHTTTEEKSFDLGRKGQATFYLPTADTGVLEDEEVMGDFQAYDKNPYAFATENVHGDLPVIKVGFVRNRKLKQGAEDDEEEKAEEHEAEISLGEKPKHFRFIQPADVFLDFNGSSTEEIEYPLIMDVEKVGAQDLVVKSSCILLSVPAKSDQVTVLDIRSRDDLKLKVHMRYTNARRPFSDMHEERTADLPLNIADTLITTRGLLKRDPNLVFFPKLNKQRHKKGIEFYRVRISVRLGQSVTPDDLDLADQQGEIRGSNSGLPTVTAYNTTVTVIPYVMSCKHYDETTSEFLSDRCWLSMFSNTSLLHCKCVVAAAYTGSYLVVPRLIDPVDFSLFLKFFENPIAVSLVIAIWMIFAASFIWGKLRDDKDTEACNATILEDNMDSHTYVYLVCVSTGWSIRAATSSRVYLYIVGSWDQSETHLLHDTSKRLFESGAQNWFILTTDDDLGEIRYVVVWTDFSGGHPSWFLNNVFVENLQTSEAWTCEYNGWLSVIFGGRQLVAEIPAVRDESKTRDLGLQLRTIIKTDMRNDHLWIGMFAKTAFNKFTRVKRLVTAITMLQTLMLLNLMFFGVRDEDDAGQFAEVVGQTIHVTSLIISTQSSVITTILGLILAFVLQMVRPMPVTERVDVLTDQQQSMQERHEEMKVRKQAGLWRFFPPTIPDVGDVDFMFEKDDPEDVVSGKAEYADDTDLDAAHASQFRDARLRVINENNYGDAKSGDFNYNNDRTEARGVKIKARDADQQQLGENGLDKTRKSLTWKSPAWAGDKTRQRLARKSVAWADDETRQSLPRKSYVQADDKPRQSLPRKSIVQADDKTRQSLPRKSAARADENGTRRESGEDSGSRSGSDVDRLTDEEYSEDGSAKSGEDAEKEEENQDTDYSYMLPWWSIYVTYTVLFLLNVTLAFYIMLYGLSLGYETSLEWFLAFFAGFFINVFFTMPAKVVAMATILVVFFEYRMTMKDQSPLKKLAEGMKLLEKERGARKGTHGKLYRKRRRMHPEPLSTEEAKQVLERLHIEKEAKEMMRDLILYTLFTITVLGIISAHVQVEAQYQQGVNVEAELLGVIGSGKDDSDDRDSLSKVHSVETLWRYLVDVVTPRLVPEVDAITSHISRSYFLMTHARLRQVRIGLNATDDCLQNIPRAVWPRDNKFACVSSLWGDEPEETRHFNHSWKTPYWQNGSNLLDSAHRYWSEQELDTEAFVGEHGIYSGGGYVVTFLREDPEAVQSSLKKLHLNDWIDRLTKCVFLEFTVYNPNAEMYTQVVLAFEVDKAGAVYTTKSVHTAILSSKNRRNTTWIRMAEAAAAVCVLFYLFKAINEILHTSLGMYFSNTWNWIELLVTVASFLCMVFYLFRLTTYLTVMQRFEIFGHGFFLDFTQVFYWQRVFHVNLAIFGALVILKLVKITAFNPFTKVFVRTMLIGQKDFVGHMFSTIIIMFAFASLGRLLFGCASLSYSTMDRALVTLLFFILGESDYPVFVTINEYIGNFFFFTFLVVSQYLLINLFIAILRDSMELSRYKPYTREEAIVRYMIDATMLYFNLTARNRQRDDVKSPFSA